MSAARKFSKRRLLILAAAAALCVAVVVAFTDRGRAAARGVWTKTKGPYTVEDRLAQYGGTADARLRGPFEAAGLRYPPKDAALLAFKDVRTLEVYGRDAATWKFVVAYPIRGMSGKLGPKLREGDRQAPEGVYAIEWLNPNSSFHLSLKLDYPNAFDREMGAVDGRKNLGGDIMIHGGSASIGCLAMGDDAAEDLFVLAARVGRARVRAIVSPTDFRDPAARAPATDVSWSGRLYDRLRAELSAYPRRL